MQAENKLDFGAKLRQLLRSGRQDERGLADQMGCSVASVERWVSGNPPFESNFERILANLAVFKQQGLDTARAKEIEQAKSEFRALWDNAGGGTRPGKKSKKRSESNAQPISPPPTTIQAPAKPGAREYLHKLTEKYQWLKLQDFDETRTPDIQLETVYVALKAQADSAYDRQQAAELHDTEVRELSGAKTLDAIAPATLAEADSENIRHTYRPARELARQRVATVAIPNAATVREGTLGEAVRNHHKIVILGGPGSGKTTLGRWLCLQIARAYLREIDSQQTQRVLVPVSQLDPDALPNDSELVDLGPTRLPIFLRLAHFARELSERGERHEPSIELEQYLGLDLDSRELADGLAATDRNALFLKYLAENRAVVVLDGLDELPESTQIEGSRRSVLAKVQNFIGRHRPTDTASKPCEVGGNQVIVTSRYVGYKASSIQADCVHFGIQPMTRLAVERFVHSWTKAVKKQATEAVLLIGAIYDPKRQAVRELATNPLLVTILATVFWRDRQLPDQRAALYSRVIENLVRMWLRRKECKARQLTREELLAALEPLAAEMQGSTGSNGLISLGRIGDLIGPPLAHFRGMQPSDRKFRPILKDLLATIPKQVGLLAEQSSGNYAFFHRTFQEFLAAQSLLANHADAQKIVDVLDNPIWREPVLLALGFVMLDASGFGTEQRIKFLTDVLAADGAAPLIPRAALLMVTALPNLRDVPNDVVANIVSRLLVAYQKNLTQQASAGLREPIERAFLGLRDSEQSHAVLGQMVDTIRQPDHGGLIAAAAQLLRSIQWVNTEVIEALLSATAYDRSELGWPIHRMLQESLGRSAQQRPDAILEIDFERIMRLLPMRKMLENSPDIVAFVRCNAPWLQLLITLYGGLGQSNLIQEQKSAQLKRLQNAQATTNWVDRSKPEPFRKLALPEFSPTDIVCDLVDSWLSRILQDCLGARCSAVEIQAELERYYHSIGKTQWRSGATVAEAQAEVLTALVALGADVFTLLPSDSSQRAALTERLIVRLNWLNTSLQEPLLRASELAALTIPPEAPAPHQLVLLRIIIRRRLACGGAPLLVSDQIPERILVPCTAPEVRHAIAAEYWSWLLSGIGDPDRQFAPSDQMLFDFHELIDAWSQLPWAANQLAMHRLPLSLPVLMPRADSLIERYLVMLEVMLSVPAAQHGLAGFVLGCCWPILQEHPDLAWETLAVCLNLGKHFMRSYLTAVGGQRLRHRNRVQNLDPRATELAALEAQVIACLGAESIARASRLELFDAMTGIDDPYVQLRARLALLMSLQGAELRDEERAIQENMVLTLLYRVDDPHAKIWALERCLAFFQPTLPVAILLEWIEQIDDVENRARALIRLAMLPPNAELTLILGALEAINLIPDEQRKAETIIEIRAACGGNAQLTKALKAIAFSIRDPWERQRALGQESKLLRIYRNGTPSSALIWRLPQSQFSSNEVIAREPASRHNVQADVLPWSLLYLSTVVAEVNEGLEKFSGTSDLWNRLVGPDRTDRKSAALALPRNRPEGVSVSSREAQLLERIVQTENAEDIDGLWPYLECPNLGVRGLIGRWLKRRDRAGQWAALIHAEWGLFTPEIVTTVIELLANSTDRLRLRAALALHGVTPVTSNPSRRWSVRSIGAESINELARHACQFSYLPSVRSTINWTQCDIVHDHQGALVTWLSQLAEGGRNSPAAWILSSIESLEVELIPSLLTVLPAGSPHVQQTLLLGLARLANCSSTLKSAAKDVRAALAQVPIEVRKSVHSLRDGAATVLKIVKETVESKHPESLDHARHEIEGQIQWLDDKHLADDDACLKQLSAIGGGLYIKLGDSEGRNSYWASANKAAQTLAGNAPALNLLLNWLESLSSNSAEATKREYARHLLTATEAVARLSPDAFATRANPEFWEPMLTAWIQYDADWVTRMAAVRLLGRLRCLSPLSAPALWSAMNDVSHVQQAAYAAMSDFRRLKGDVLPTLLEALEGSDHAVIAATTTLLVSISSAEISSQDRCRILRALEQAAARVGTLQPVFLMEERSGFMSIKRLDFLDRVLYSAILEINGLSS
jgi:hypothetical protein